MPPRMGKWRHMRGEEGAECGSFKSASTIHRPSGQVANGNLKSNCKTYRQVFGKPENCHAFDSIDRRSYCRNRQSQR